MFYDAVRLTTRQLEVVLLASEGLRHAEVGVCLGIGVKQVRRHLDNARTPTGTSSTPQLVTWARRSGLVPTPPARVS
jgi:DNA-binding CsgD family transcriptional regulator